MEVDENNVMVNNNKLPQIAYNDIRIKDIGSVRLSNALSSIDIHTLEDLLSFIKGQPIDDLLKVRNFGKNSLSEVYQILESFHISKDDIGSMDILGGFDTSICLDNLPSDSDEVIYIPNIPLANLGRYCDGIKELAWQNINTTTDLYLYCCQKGIVDIYRSNVFGKESTHKIASLLAIMSNRCRWNELQQMIVAKRDQHFKITPVARPIDSLFASVEDCHIPEVVDLIQQIYLSSIEN